MRGKLPRKESGCGYGVLSEFPVRTPDGENSPQQWIISVKTIPHLFSGLRSP